MKRSLPALLLMFVLAVGCYGNGGSGEPDAEDPASETTAGRPAETTGQGTTAQEVDGLVVEQLLSGAPGSGPKRPRVVMASSAAALFERTGLEVPDSGGGTYLAAFWGRKPTGGFAIGADSARREGDEVVVRLKLEKPPEDAFVTQALTYPYAVAVVRGLDPAGREFVFVDGEDRELGWPVRMAGG
jgi:hypothetical protein